MWCTHTCSGILPSHKNEYNFTTGNDMDGVGGYCASVVAQVVKNMPTVCETWVRSLSREDPLEEGMATHSSVLTWRVPMDRGAWWATTHGATQSQTQLSD